MSKTLAVLYLYLPSGECLNRQVVELTPEGKVERYYPLNCELPFAEWKKEAYEITQNSTLRKKNA